MTVAIAAILHEPNEATAERSEWRRRSDGFDLIGFVLVPTLPGALEIALDRGLEDDWLVLQRQGRGRLRAGTHADHPVGDTPPQGGSRRPDAGDAPVQRKFPGDAGNRRHPAGDHAVPVGTAAAGFGYTATCAGLVLSSGGIVTMLIMFVMGRLSAKVQPKRLIVARSDHQCDLDV
jgi:MFS transporter, DHA2 family, multidrug resistance protein